MGRTALSLILSAGILTAGVVILLGLSKVKAPPTRVEQKVSIPLVEAALIERPAVDGFEIEVNGVVAPKRELTLAAEVQGRVVEKTQYCWAGQTVHEGDILLRIDSRPLELQRRTLDSELNQIKADLERLDIEIENNMRLLTLAEDELGLRLREQQRVAQLVQRNASSASERDQADSQVLVSRQTLQQLANEKNTFEARRHRLDAERENVEARRDQVLYDLERTTVRAPVEGLIVESVVEQDAYVRPGDALVRIEDTATVEVRCSLQMDDLYWLAGGYRMGSDLLTGDAFEPASSNIPQARATVSHSLAGRLAHWEGFLARFEGTGVDEQTRTVPCRVEVSDPSARAASSLFPLQRGMFVTVTLHVERPRVPLLRIPKRALQPNNMVWLVRDGRLRIESVVPVKTLHDSILIRGDGEGSELGVGDLVVVSPLPIANDGMAVEVVPAPTRLAAR